MTDDGDRTSAFLTLSNTSTTRFGPVNQVKVKFEWKPDLENEVGIEFGEELLESGAEIVVEPEQVVQLTLSPLMEPEDFAGERVHRIQISTDDPNRKSFQVDILISKTPPVPEWLTEENAPVSAGEVVKIEAEVSKVRAGVVTPAIGRAVLRNGGGGALLVKEIEVPTDYGAWFNVSFKEGEGIRSGDSRIIEFQVSPEKIPRGIFDGHISLVLKAEGVEPHPFRVRVVIHQPPVLEVVLPEFQSWEGGVSRLVCAPYGRQDFEVQLLNRGTKPLNVTGVICDSPFLRLYLGGNLRVKERTLSEPIPVTPGKTERAFKLSCNLESLVHDRDYPAEIVFLSDAVNAEHRVRLLFHVKRKTLDTKFYHDSYIGVDFGTSNSCVAVRHAQDVRKGMEEAFRVLTLTPESELTGHDPDPTTLPSMIFFRETDDPLIGEAAKGIGLGKEERLFRSFKRTIGMMVEQQVGGTVFTSEDLAEIIFGSLIDAALRDLDHFPTRVVATCPANFYHYQRASVLRACRRALCRRALRAHADQMRTDLRILDESPEVGRPFREFLEEKADARGLLEEVRERFLAIHPGIDWDLESTADCMLLLLYLSTSRRELIDFGDKGGNGSKKIAAERITRDLIRSFFDGIGVLGDLVAFVNTPQASLVREAKSLELLNIFEDFCFDVLRSLQIADVLILDEPSAAAYAYVLHEFGRLEKNPEGEREYIVVYDFGGGTFDVSVMSIETRNEIPQVEVIHTDGINELGGDDIDHEMINWVLERIDVPKVNREYVETNIYRLDALIRMKAGSQQEIQDLRVNVRRAKKVLKDWAEGAKINFSTLSAETLPEIPARFTLDGLGVESVDLLFQREDFHGAITGSIEKTIEKTRDVLERAAEKEARSGREFRLARFVLAGKSSRIPLIRSMILRDGSMGITDDLFFAGFGKMEKACVARGAAYYGFQQAGETSAGFSVRTAARPLSHTVGYLERRGPREKFYPVGGLEKGTPVDGEMARGHLIRDFTPITILQVAQNGGNDNRVEGNRDIIRVGTLGWRKLVPNLRKGEKAEVVFLVDRNGIVRVEAAFRGEKIGEFRATPIGLRDLEPFLWI
ncbi:MAG: Hsp70 family protein [Candidatus Eisenbacteria bacterium]